MKVKEYRYNDKYMITIFEETGDVFIMTKGDIHIIKCKRLFKSEEVK